MPALRLEGLWSRWWLLERIPPRELGPHPPWPETLWPAAALPETWRGTRQRGAVPNEIVGVPEIQRIIHVLSIKMGR